MLSVRRFISSALWPMVAVVFHAGLGLADEPRTNGENVVLTNSAQVLALPAAAAAKGIPVRLQTVVIDEAFPPQRSLLAADESGGIYLLATNLDTFAGFHANDVIDVNGVTDPGEFAPIVRVSSAKKTGSAPIPPARPATVHQLLSGSMDAQLVDITGVVQQFTPPTKTPPDVSRVILSVDGSLIHVRVEGPQNAALAVDAEVEVRAICLYQFGSRRQIITPVLTVPPGLPVAILKPPASDPFASPVQRVGDLLGYNSQNPAGHRVHVRGVITATGVYPSLWMRDETAGLQLLPAGRRAADLRVGDVVDVLGFQKYGAATPVLEEAVYRKIGHLHAPAPTLVSNLSSAFDNDNNLVVANGRLLDATRAVDGISLNLQMENGQFEAFFAGSPGADWPNPEPGSLLRVAGICSVHYDESLPMTGILQPQSFRIGIRDKNDLQVLASPPWRNRKHAKEALLVVAAALFLLLGITMARANFRLKEQQNQRAMAEKEFSAILTERNRVAREFHDTLAQGLTAISLQLRIAKKGAAGAGELLNSHLNSAQELVSQCLQEARNSIWNMRAQVLETTNLAGALRDILAKIGDGQNCQTEFNLIGTPCRLAPVTENNLLRIGQEAITNALRHAQAKRICVKLQFRKNELVLSVSNDGLGFEPAALPKNKSGFGLVGLRERVVDLDAKLRIESLPEGGTRICVVVPLID